MSSAISTTIPFVKMHGIGNDFILLDQIGDAREYADLPGLAREFNDRRFGVGGDGLILVERGEGSNFRMRMFNPDGSESEMCGNGIRCFARLLADRGYLAGTSAKVETGAGLLEVELVGEDSVRVDMGIAKLGRAEIGMTAGQPDPFLNGPLGFEGLAGTAVSMGNPHLDIFVPDVAKIPLEDWGPKLEHHELFPARVNVHFIQVISPTHLKMRTWERGAGITLACGTGACSVAVAGLKNGLSEISVKIDLPGGQLQIDIQDDLRVFMTGPAKTVYSGFWPVG